MTRRLLDAMNLRAANLLLVAAAIAIGGLQLRRWTWKETEPVRFEWDVRNGFHWGERVLQQGEAATGLSLARADTWQAWHIFFSGYIGLYDAVEAEAANRDYGLDYPPLRLLAMSLWAKSVRAAQPLGEIHRPEQHAKPLLHANLACEALSALAMFLLVRFWVQRDNGRTVPAFARGFALPTDAVVRGFLAATFVWLNPSIILTSHGWPQWDVWIVPFYLFAALCGSTERWFWCGCLLGIGGMLKGQLLIVAPFFLLWPLFQRKQHAALRVAIGFAVALAVVLAPWLLNDARDRSVFAVIVGASVLLLRFSAHARRHLLLYSAAVAAMAAFVIGACSGGSFGWLRVGFIYGADLPQGLYSGTGTVAGACYNLPSLLAGLGLSLKHKLLEVDAGGVSLVLTLQWALRLTYFAGLAACAMWAARRAREHDAKTLLAVAAPWLLMLALLGQMRERYSLWGAALTAVTVALSMRLSVLHLVFSVLSTAMIAQVMLAEKQFDPTPKLLDLLDAQHALGAWIFLICAALFMAAAGGVPEFARRFVANARRS